MSQRNQNEQLSESVDRGETSARRCTLRRVLSRLRIGRFRLLAGEEGTQLVETAVAFTVLLPMLFGAFEFSLALYTYQNVADAARTAARWAAVRGSQSCANESGLSSCNATATQITTYVQSLNYPVMISSNLGATPTWSSASVGTPTSWTACTTVCNSPGNQVAVTVTYTFPITIPLVKLGSIPISSTGSMVISQ